MTVEDYQRALKTYKGSAKGPCAIEVKNRGETKWRKYKPHDLKRIHWVDVDAARIHFADKVWRDNIPDENYTTVVRIYARKSFTL